MLVEFRVENHRSIRTEQVFSMEARKEGEGDTRPRLVPGYPDPLLPVGVLYGANASGKSNLLSALAFMREAVLESHRGWSVDEGVPRDPFAWGLDRIAPSMFEVILVLHGVKYQYGFTASNAEFLEEWLYAWPNGHKQTWFERDKLKFEFGSNFGGGENKLIEEVTRPNALFLSAAVQHKQYRALPIHGWFRDLQAINVAQRHGAMRPGSGFSEFMLRRLFEEDEQRQQLLFPNDEQSPPMLEQFRAMLRSADIGITDVRILKQDEPRRVSGRYQLKHQCDDENSWLPLEEESRGTKTLFRMALPILQTLQYGDVAIVDELEASLHPALAQKIVRQFNDPVTNPRNAQLIFTTHDTNLLGTTMGEPALRRDQVWLTEKNDAGATELYPLTDFKPRKSENLERGYLQGRYGAIPFLGNFMQTSIEDEHDTP